MHAANSRQNPARDAGTQIHAGERIFSSVLVITGKGVNWALTQGELTG
jgi:hypothetical protein